MDRRVCLDEVAKRNHHFSALAGIEFRSSSHSGWTSRLVFVKLTVAQLIKKFLAFYGTRNFLVVFTRARHLYLS